MKYAVVMEHEPASYGASVPGLPGCVAVAPTRDRVERLIQEAFRTHLAEQRAEGLAVPEPLTQVTTVEV
jgi:predicted RNase H-like HicB family nuclease